MSKDLASLWPESIRADIQSPWRILHAQAEALRRQTMGILVGEITKMEDGNGEEILAFDIVAPELNGFRKRIMKVSYEMNIYYPSTVDSDSFNIDADHNDANYRDVYGNPVYLARDDNEMMELVGKVLRSSYVVSIASSLICRVNEKLEEKEHKAKKQSMTRTIDDSTESETE